MIFLYMILAGIMEGIDNYYTLAQWSCWRVYWFHSVCPSICPASHVCSVGSTVLVGFIWYLHILSSNFRRCVACKVACKILKFEFLPIFQNLQLWLCLVLTWDLIWITSMGNKGWGGGGGGWGWGWGVGGWGGWGGWSQNEGVLVESCCNMPVTIYGLHTKFTHHHLTGDKTLPEPMMTQFTDGNVCH